MTTKKVALVTGAGQGIGRGIALKLAQDGFDIGIADIPAQEQKGEAVAAEIAALGRSAVFVPTDVSSRSDVEAAVEQTASRLGGFDVIVNNAGIAQVKPLLEVTEHDLETVFSVNVNSVIFGIQAAVRKFDELGVKGRIVNAASIAAIRGFPILGAYSASKFAVRGITQVAAQELAPKGHTVNAYAPGIVGTGMWDLIDAEMHKINGKPLGKNLQDNVEGIALGRIETPEDVAGVVSFLAGDNAVYVTGQVIIVDGGMLYN
ncbi:MULTISPECIES: acetoin reductase [Micrococcales]|uniref:diacetyl reductase [(S)-acetoin forming] n=2 Tax=Microbacterium TaxID=33882 RepID=A0A543BLD7_9MICO|nr:MULTISPECIES: acetoin reductase [Microbacterium]TQL85636.1 meso-butanediol dehydrogenase/(S,S)-butanediol dehydrogenase/diacetyl reductase [Microbacterium saperdae]GGM62059.1 diacetyl reductase [Microbacterium saperdae]SJN45030.1 2,3-butanediol dehydrogenase, S-alcohol forming, (S)-acetoin-specific [Microbacterium esteraromaticum]